MKKVIWTVALLFVIILAYPEITNAFISWSIPSKPISGSLSLLILGSGLIGIASWGRRKYR